jgi:hypothetical protein
VKKLILIILLICSAFLGNSQKIRFVRVCNAGINNNLFWQFDQDLCTTINTIKIYGRESLSFSFYGIDSGINLSNQNYLHVNANVPAIKTWQYFVATTVVCNSDTSTFFSDTLIIDDIKPDSTILDSVSVDPISNVVLLGWRSNKTPDFASYYLYNTDRADPRLAENYRDTSYIDLTPVNPRNQSLTYDITSSDSCDNRRDYGNYSHKTICLRVNIDTCKNQSILNWNAYKGWNTEKQYLYRKVGAGQFGFLDSLAGNVVTYTDINIPANTTVQYFVRAFKESDQFSASSSSNSNLPISTGKAQSPIGTEIAKVTINQRNKVELLIKPNPFSQYGGIDIYRFNDGSAPTYLKSTDLNNLLVEDETSVETIKYNYILISLNVCQEPADTSLPSNNIVLGLSGAGPLLDLNWNDYFTWNSGVKEYVIYRASGNNLTEANNFVVYKTPGLDTFDIDIIEELIPVKCYRVEAIEQNGIATSLSNVVCYINEGKIYYPNALVINGVNNTFNFYGPGLELEKSSIRLYNRWGEEIYKTSNLINGWNGTNKNGEFINTGVYVFIADIVQGKEIITIKGNISVIQ